MQVRRNDTVVSCSVCGRTLLLGERVEPYRVGRLQAGVCRLCTIEADRRGWLREGAPTPPPVEPETQRGPGALSRLVGVVRGTPEPPAAEAAEPAPAESPDALAMAARDGVEAFNQSPYRRTVSGIAKSLGEPRVSVVALAGARPEVVVTVAWEISWYQYRVEGTVGRHVRLEGRGDDPEELDERWQRWNARVGQDGRLALSA
jgi:hypothetical protein